MSANYRRAARTALSLAILQQRSELLRRLRQFFYERAFIEVETPLVSDEVIPERYIDPMSVAMPAARKLDSRASGRRPPWLQASPELHMKQLMAAGAEAIFQVTRSFRAGEHGQLHNPEFTIVEWYRRGDDMQAGIDLLDELCQTLLQTLPAERMSYADAFQRYLAVCPHTCSVNELAASAATVGVEAPVDFDNANREQWLNLLLATVVEPHLGADRPAVLYHYPAGQAALAKIEHPGGVPPVASRFEIYFRGIELANGYHELTSAGELRKRLELVNSARLADDREALPLPESLFAALERGLPDCTGVALGFDRLVMLAVGAESIHEVR